jgi:hypothetical protein
MDHLIAQHDFEAVATSLLPLVPFMSGKSCEEGTGALVKLLSEGLEMQEAACKRADELKSLEPKTLLDLFTLESNAPVEKVLLKASASASSSKTTSRNKKTKAEPEEADQHQSQSRGPRKRTKKAEESEAEKQEKLKKQRNRKDEEDEELLTVAWNGVDHPSITRLFRCEGKDDTDFRVQVHAKGQNEMRGRRPETQFSLNAAQLREIDDLPKNVKSMVKERVSNGCNTVVQTEMAKRVACGIESNNVGQRYSSARRCRGFERSCCR